MFSMTTKVTNPTGLHARPATLFVEKANTYSSDIFVKNLSKKSTPKNAKSIIHLLTLAISSGADIEISAEGEDEKDAVENLIAMVESGMGEEA